METSQKSIIVVEEVDCTINLTGQRQNSSKLETILLDTNDGNNESKVTMIARESSSLLTSRTNLIRLWFMKEEWISTLSYHSISQQSLAFCLKIITTRISIPSFLRLVTFSTSMIEHLIITDVDESPDICLQSLITALKRN